jgi:4-hydroxybutyrate CoA-transferase
LAGRQKKEPPAYIKDICGYVSSLIPDRATIQIGVGRITEPLVKMGLLDGKHDIGYHSQATPPGVISLVRDGVITGKYKNINQGKCTVTSIGGDTKEELEYVHMNPLFELVDVGYLEDIRVISAHDNFVAINSALQIDLLGQVAAESIGERFIAAAGGQTPFTIGAAMSKGGKSLTVMPSTAANGTVSRIKPILDPGTPVTVPRIVTMYVVTEYGIANLWGKSTRDKALELIGIAHPDFRDELRREALRRFWPCSSP